MKNLFNFLKQLSENNNREWFYSHKEEYLSIRSGFEEFAQKLIDKICQWDEDIANSNLKVKDCTYRINRDTRFSKNKEPYKTHMGIFICKGGKKSPYAGYYLHLEPPVNSDAPLSMGGCFIIAGTYHFEPKVLRSIRDEIHVNGDSFIESINQAKGFKIDESNMLKKVPSEFAGAPLKWHNLLKMKNYGLIKAVDMEYICKEDAIDIIADDFKSCSNFIKKLNMAIDYAYEEM